MIPHEGIILAKEQSGHSYIFWVSYFLIYAYFNILAQSQILGNSLYLFEKRIILSEKKKPLVSSLIVLKLQKKLKTFGT